MSLCLGLMGVDDEGLPRIEGVLNIVTDLVEATETWEAGWRTVVEDEDPEVMVAFEPIAAIDELAVEDFELDITCDELENVDGCFVILLPNPVILQSNYLMRE